jgi:hypothetical protein
VDLRATVAYARATHVEACPDIGPACASEPQPEPYWHDVSTVVSEIPLEVTYGVLPWLAAEVRLPLRIVGVWPRYSTFEGVELPLSFDEHHRRETLVGPADPWVTARIGGTAFGVVANARIGLSLPLGKTEPDPYALGRLGLPHQHIQFGSGTVMPVLGGSVQRGWSRVEVGLSAFAVFNFADNSHGYRAPSRGLVSMRVTAPFLHRKLRPFVALDFNVETTERWHGRLGDEGRTDRADILAGGGVAWQVEPRWAVDVAFRMRLARLSEATTLDYPGFLQVGGTFMLDTPSPFVPAASPPSSNW